MLLIYGISCQATVLTWIVKRNKWLLQVARCKPSRLNAQLQHLKTKTTRLSTAPPPLPIPPASVMISHQSKPCLPPPVQYSDEPNVCRAFLTKCSLFFSLQPLTFSTEQSKVALVMTLLLGHAALWGTAVWKNQHPCCSSFQVFSDEMRRVVGLEAACVLVDLRQGPVSD